MILLILGVLLVIVVIFLIYKCLKEKEKELFNNISEKEYVQEEDWEKYYENRKSNINSDIPILKYDVCR